MATFSDRVRQERRGGSHGSRAALAWLGLVLALLVVATPAVAAHFAGKRYLPNPSHTTRMPDDRAQGAAKRVVRRVFAVRPGTEMYMCSRHARNESGCDFAFTSRQGNDTCGNARVVAYRSRIVVYYSADNAGCGDF